MRQFYLEYKDFPNLQRLVGEIGRCQNLVIIAKELRNKLPNVKELESETLKELKE